jgi:hypothetical protein
MEKVNEKVDMIKVCDYIIQNLLKLVKKEKIDNIKFVFKNSIIHIDMDNCIYTISNVMMYKRFIDKVSYKYKILLKYLPKEIDDTIIKKLLIYYYKNNYTTLFINKNYIDIS